jgi:hypothetical protein
LRLAIPRNHKDPLVLSYLTLRKAVGWIGLTLPIILAFGEFAFQRFTNKPVTIEASISAYYYTYMGNIFVGLLCAIGIFHLATEGYDLSDRIAGRLVCLFAFGVAWFPTTPELKSPLTPTHAQNIIGDIHYIFAALLFLTLAFFCIFQFTQTAELSTRTRRKKERNNVYYVCGGIILGCIAVIGSVKALEHLDALRGFRIWLNSWNWNFWLESFALFAFGAAFLVKGEFILKDESRGQHSEVDQMSDSDPTR